MPAPEGNKNALGNNGGRPKLPFDRDIEFNELLKWALTDDALVLRMFPATRGYSHDTMQRWCEENIEYCDIYNMAKELIGARRELLLIKNNSSSPFQRYAAYYDKALHKFERKDKADDAELRNEEHSKSPQKMVFEVNYKNDSNHSVEILPSIVSTADSPST